MAHAASSTTRAKTFGRLSDWQSIWVVTGSTKSFDPSGKPPPYNAEWLAKYKGLQKDPKRRDPFEQSCIVGVPRLSASKYPFMIMITPDETALHYSHREVRHVWTDGRDHPPIDEQWPMPMGDSVGRWQDQTLMIDTVSVKPDLWIDDTGATLSSQAQIVERITMIDKHHLKNEITINDPTSLTQPWNVTRLYKRSNVKELSDELCKPATTKPNK